MNDRIFYFNELDKSVKGAYSLLLDILPGQNKKVISVGSQFPSDILKMLDTQELDSIDSVLLTNGDVWRYQEFANDIFNHVNLLGKNVFIQTLGYTNTKFSNTHWELVFPVWYWLRTKTSIPFSVLPTNLDYGFSCLNNVTSIDRVILGHNFYINTLLNDIIFSQNLLNFEYTLIRIEQDLNILNLEKFYEYSKLLPIKTQHEINSVNPNFKFYKNTWGFTNTDHPAFTNAYCNIITESATEEYPYSKNINLPVITEKSHKPFISKQIPLFLAAQGHLGYIKGLGFETMDDLLPAGYDNMRTLEKINVIVNIVAKGKEFIKDFYFDHIREIQHNYELAASNQVENLILQRIKNIID